MPNDKRKIGFSIWFVGLLLIITLIAAGFILNATESTDCPACLIPDRTFKSGKFFPEGFSEFDENWYGGQLRAMKESVMVSRCSDCDTSFRFLWLRTFHHPICVRVEERKDGSFVLIAKELDGAGGYEPGNIKIQKEKSLTKEQYAALTAKINKMDFWRMPTEEKNIFGCDGAQWIIEGVRSTASGQKYQVVDRWCAQGAVRDFGVELMKLGDILPASDVY